MFTRDDEFNTKWQLYRIDINNDVYFVVWQEFLTKIAAHKSMLDAGDELGRAPVWLEKRFGISNKRLSHVSVTFGKDFLTETTLENSNEAPAITALNKEQLKIELEAWTPRNLNILFLEFLIDYEIAVLQNPDSSQIKSLISDIEMNEKKHLEHYYKNLLKAINDAHFECYEATDIHTINVAHISKYDLEEEFKILKFHYIPLLQLLTTVEQFYQLKMVLQSKQYYAVDLRGTTIDRTVIDTILSPESTIRETGLLPSARNDGSETDDVKNTVNTEKRSLGYQIGIALAVGSLLGLLALGIATAIIFTGGTAVILGTATIAAILVTSFMAPVFGGFLTGLSIGLNDKIANTNCNTTFINDQLSHKHTPGETACAISPSAPSSATHITSIKSQPPQDAPCVQNPSPSPAPTPSGSLR